MNTGGYIGITLSVCLSVRMSEFVQTISPELLNHFEPNLVWWCIIIRRCVLLKNWITVFIVKVRFRAYIIKKKKKDYSYYIF